MVTEPQFQLTTKDHAILQTMLERHRGPRGPYTLLLERKVRDGAIFFRDDIPPGVVTLGTNVSYFVDGVPAGPRVIVQGEADGLPPFVLSIQTLHGLALLGLAEGSSIAIEPGDGAREILTVKDVLSQPEARARAEEEARGVVQGDSAGRTENIVSFAPRRARAGFAISPNHDDDDPGPRAA